ncbi:MAG TPA: prolipoprotein diacylglyceryl transferase family protein [Acidobacteriota bacterium]|nr:prolipoprotein diacylglyceryl transferase family protein [Acidobacteriota bacterium]
MFPRLLSTPYFTIYTFGLFLALAYLAALVWLIVEARRAGIDREKAAALGLWTVIGAIIGARLSVILRMLLEYSEDISRAWSIAVIQDAGDFFGGFIGGLIAAWIFFYRHPELPRWRMADACGASIALGQVIGRVGSFMAGDSFGARSSLPWAVVFRDPDTAIISGVPLGVPLHPVQLYESIACLALFFFLVWMARRKRFDGQIILCYSLIYAVMRFLLEFARGDADRGFLFYDLISYPQFFALMLFVIAVPLYIKRRF